MALQQTMIPLSFISPRRVQIGSTFSLNEFVPEANKTLTRIYRIMTIDRVNGKAGCRLEREQEVRV